MPHIWSRQQKIPRVTKRTRLLSLDNPSTSLRRVVRLRPRKENSRQGNDRHRSMFIPLTDSKLPTRFCHAFPVTHKRSPFLQSTCAMSQVARASCQSNRSGPSTLFPKPADLTKPTLSCLHHFSPVQTTRISCSKFLRGPLSSNQHVAGHFTEMGTVVHGPTFVHSGPTYGREERLRGGGRRERGGEGGR